MAQKLRSALSISPVAHSRTISPDHAGQTSPTIEHVGLKWAVREVDWFLKVRLLTNLISPGRQMCSIHLFSQSQHFPPVWAVWNKTVTTRPANPTQSGGRRARPCRRVFLSGNTGPGRKPRRAHTHGVDRGKTRPAANTSCVTRSLLARVEVREATLTPRPHIPSTTRPFPPDPPKTPFRHPQRTLRKPSPQGPRGQSQRRTAESSDTALS